MIQSIFTYIFEELSVILRHIADAVPITKCPVGGLPAIRR